jgi:hypothetical protein
MRSLCRLSALTALCLLFILLTPFLTAATADTTGPQEEPEAGWQWEYLAGAAVVLGLLIFMISRRPGRSWRQELREQAYGDEEAGGETAQATQAEPEEGHGPRTEDRAHDS